MAIVKDWVDSVLLDLNYDEYVLLEIAAAIEKHCPFKRGIAYEEVKMDNIRRTVKNGIVYAEQRDIEFPIKYNGDIICDQCRGDGCNAGGAQCDKCGGIGVLLAKG